jgi:signal transduction histidine kinase
LDRVQANVENMGVLIRGILDLSRLNTRRNQGAKESSRSLLDRALAGLQDAAEKRSVAITITGDHWPELEGDLPRLQSIFGNLVDNALKYLGDDNQTPEIEVGCKVEGRQATFWVRDNGVGISADHLERVFRPLERLGSVETHGIGMGLTLVRKIVETSGGELTLESELGQGSVFRFTLPIASGANAAPQAGEGAD